MLHIVVPVRGLHIGFDLNQGAVSENQTGVHGLAGVAAAVLVIAGAHGQDISVVVSHGGLINVSHVAVGIQISHNIVLHVLGDQTVSRVHGLVVLISGAVHHKVVAVSLISASGVGADAGNLAAHLLGGIDVLNLTVGEGVHDDLILLKIGGVILVVVVGGAVAEVGQGDGAVVLIDLVHLGGVVLDDGDIHGLVRAVHIDLGDHAVAGAGVAAQGLLHEVLVVVGLVGGQVLALILHGLAVERDGPLIVVGGGLAHLIVQGLAGHLRGVGIIGSLGKGADLLGLILPDIGGTAEVVITLFLGQVALVQFLAQLNNLTEGHGGVGIGGQTLFNGVGILFAAGDVVVLHAADEGHVAHRERAVCLCLHGAGLQGVQHQLGQVVAGHGFLQSRIHAYKQVDLVALSRRGQLPVRTKIGAVLEVAQGLHQHQGRLSGGHVLAAAIGGGAGAGGDAVGVAGGHIGLRPGGHIRKRRGVLVAGHVVRHQVGHDNGHLVAGDILIGIKVAAFITDHDANRLEHFNGFHVVGVGHIRVAARGAGAHHHQAGNHGRGETQAESTLQVSHWNSSF